MIIKKHGLALVIGWILVILYPVLVYTLGDPSYIFWWHGLLIVGVAAIGFGTYGFGKNVYWTILGAIAQAGAAAGCGWGINYFIVDMFLWPTGAK